MGARLAVTAAVVGVGYIIKLMTDPPPEQPPRRFDGLRVPPRTAAAGGASAGAPGPAAPDDSPASAAAPAVAAAAAEEDERRRALIKEAIKRKDRGIDVYTKYNIAVCGEVKSGKSSLVNAIRGVDPARARVSSAGSTAAAAAEGITECTTEPKPFPMPDCPFVVLWDLPGAGTLKCPAKEYFDTYKLQYYDVLLLVCSKTFSELDVDIAAQALEHQLPCFFVRSHFDEDLRNRKKDELKMRKQQGKRNDRASVAEILPGLANEVAEQIRANVKAQLRMYNETASVQRQRTFDLNQHIYIVNKEGFLRVKRKISKALQLPEASKMARLLTAAASAASGTRETLESVVKDSVFTVLEGFGDAYQWLIENDQGDDDGNDDDDDGTDDCDKMEMDEVQLFQDILRAAFEGRARNGTDKNEPQPRPEWMCPITQELMDDPVVAADGCTYERDAIELWLARGSNLSPSHGNELENRNLVPNLAIRSAIVQHRDDVARYRAQRAFLFGEVA
jgi:GTP-binding protein EngB required for normal cell division